MNDKTDLSKLNLQATLRIDALYYHFALETYNGVQSAERQYNRKISSIYSPYINEIPLEPDTSKTTDEILQERLQIERRTWRGDL